LSPGQVVYNKIQFVRVYVSVTVKIKARVRVTVRFRVMARVRLALGTLWLVDVLTGDELTVNYLAELVCTILHIYF